MTTQEDIVRLQALPLPRCGNLTLTVRPKEYGEQPTEVELGGFERFLPHTGGCVSCGAPLGGLLGSFSWGLAWGEGTCSSCGYPGRAYHKVTLPDGREEILSLVLQYHPEELIIKESTER